MPAVCITKTITSEDVDRFAEATGDRAAIHIDANFARLTAIGERIAHGALLVGLMSAAATRWEDEHGIGALSIGYRNVRFLRPVRLGDSVTVTYSVEDPSPTGDYEADVCAVNQRGELVGTATHLSRRWGPASATPKEV
jgi:3-hydroxybutyryl-CoA dehydratase